MSKLEAHGTHNEITVKWVDDKDVNQTFEITTHQVGNEPGLLKVRINGTAVALVSADEVWPHTENPQEQPVTKMYGPLGSDKRRTVTDG